MRSTRQLCFSTRRESSSTFCSSTARLRELDATTPAKVTAPPMSATKIDSIQNLPGKTGPVYRSHHPGRSQISWELKGNQ